MTKLMASLGIFDLSIISDKDFGKLGFSANNGLENAVSVIARKIGR